MEKKSKEIAKEKDSPEGTNHKQVWTERKTRISSRRINYILKELRRGGVSRVEIYITGKRGE